MDNSEAVTTAQDANCRTDWISWRIDMTASLGLVARVPHRAGTLDTDARRRRRRAAEAMVAAGCADGPGGAVRVSVGVGGSRVDGVLDPVADQADRQHDDQQRQPREVEQPGTALGGRRSFGHQPAQ